MFRQKQHVPACAVLSIAAPWGVPLLIGGVSHLVQGSGEELARSVIAVMGVSAFIFGPGAGLVLGIAALKRRERPRWLADAGIIVSVLTALYFFRA
jgi:hypothetical protein